MSAWIILDTILLKSLETLFEVLYVMVYRLSDSRFFSVMILIMVLNLFFLFMYKNIDAVREEDCDRKIKLRRAVILAVFQIAFFVASYRFLSDLKQTGAGFIGEFSKPLLAIFALVCFSSVGFVIPRLLNRVFSFVRHSMEKKGKDSLLEKMHLEKRKSDKKADAKTFFSGTFFLSVLLGLWIPSTVLNASPQEFVDTIYFYHPLWFLVSAFGMAFGLCVVWAGIYYLLSDVRVRLFLDKCVWILSGIAVTNYIFFGHQLGVMTSDLKYENGIGFTAEEQFLDITAILTVVIVFCVIYRYRKNWISDILAVSALSLCGMTVVNVININRSVNTVKNRISENGYESMVPGFALSKTGKNVVVLMLDRAMGEYIPYIFNEKPELQEQFSGFTYYPNVVSFGGYTIFGSPALFGGYEYTPIEMNLRSEESLAFKHNEALKVMPAIFLENDYEVTVCDPPYANYQWIPDLTIYEEYPQIHSFITDGFFSDDVMRERWVCNNRRNFFLYGVLKAAPLCIQEALYEDGRYNVMPGTDRVYSSQVTEDIFNARGIRLNFMDAYNVLVHLSDMTHITEQSQNTFLMLDNNATHEPMLLQEPDYVPAWDVDNTEYGSSYQERFSVDGRILKMETEHQIKHYHANMAVMLQLGKWFDYLRENGVYDNTRIILVADHGRDLYHMDEMILEDGMDASLFYPLLMVKDFDCEGFVTSGEFMTNADVPAIAVGGIIENPVNPFTGQSINADEKTAHRQYIIYSEQCNVDINNGNTFLPGRWYSVEEDMRQMENWRLEAEDAVFPFDNQYDGE